MVASLNIPVSAQKSTHMMSLPGPCVFLKTSTEKVSIIAALYVTVIMTVHQALVAPTKTPHVDKVGTPAIKHLECVPSGHWSEPGNLEGPRSSIGLLSL
mmetsp:Transcript_53924/g.98640  ORF Transcript_53924/g.98640 Transcript_53924/m.98640 type:complete len:99 (+) Transcript_53924:234-530(+)